MNINKEKKLADETANELQTIVSDIVNKQCKNLDIIIKKMSNIEALSNDELRKLMAQSSVESYIISAFRDQSALRELCANALYKEGIANSYNTATGTVEAKKNSSITDNVEKQMVSILYSNIYDTLKTKVDEAHRLTNTISNILISRMTEAKLYYNPMSEAINLEVNNETDGIQQSN